jgi:hypothetical protein
MANPDEWDTKYLKGLKKSYVYNVVNYMIRESNNKFSRPYSLASLAKLQRVSKNEKAYFSLKEIVEKATELGFNGPDNLIEYGLNSSYEAGLVETDEKSYRLNSIFRQWVIEQSTDILTIIEKFKSKTKP